MLSSRPFIFRSKFPSEIDFCMWCALGGKAHFFSYRYQIDSAPFIETLFLSPLNCSDIFIVNQVTLYVQAYFWSFIFN